jgi:hypothetical protein
VQSAFQASRYVYQNARLGGSLRDESTSSVTFPS